MKFKDLLLLIWTVTLLLFRPSIFGERYSLLIFVFFFFVTVAILFVTSQTISFDRRRLTALALIYLCVSYFFIQGLILSDAKQTVINSAVLLFLATPCVALIINKHQEQVLRFFINFHYFLSWSAIITFVIFVLVGLSIERLPVIANLYKIAGYFEYNPIPLSNHTLIFPFSLYWSVIAVMGITFPRFVGIYTEPGMAQIFFITSFILTFFIDVKKPSRKRIVLFIGSLLLLSAAGVLNLAISILVYTFYNSSLKQYLLRALRNPIFVIAGIVGFFVLSNQAIRMVNQKFDDVSGETRLQSFQKGIQKLMLNPFFGEGYYSSFKKDASGVVVSEMFIGIPGVSYQIGLTGLLLYFICWTYSLARLSSKRSLCIYVPCLLTLLFSQPSYNDIFTWFLLLMDTKSFMAIKS